LTKSIFQSLGKPIQSQFYLRFWIKQPILFGIHKKNVITILSKIFPRTNKKNS